METSEKYFYCYDLKLFNFLKAKGIKFITKAKHYKTNDLFSLYEQSPELSAALREWWDDKPDILPKKSDE